MAEAVNERTGVAVATSVEFARSIWSRFWGLMWRRELAVGSAMLIDPCSSIHTFMMRFAIDVVFLDKEDTVTKVAVCIKPYRLAFGPRCKRVLEMPCGAAATAEIAVGDRLSFRDGA